MNTKEGEAKFVVSKPFILAKDLNYWIKFQPFYTTKPTGEGTGLGLSLSYDLIKAHGGEIKAQTKESEFAEFIIYLPD